MTKADRIRELLMTGMLPKMIAQKLDTTRQYVCKVRALMLGPAHGYRTEVYVTATNHAARRGYYAEYYARNRDRIAARKRARKAAQHAHATE